MAVGVGRPSDAGLAGGGMEIESEVVEGRAIRVGGRQLVPVVRRTVGVQRQAIISEGVAARGGAFVHLHPVGVLERRGNEERFIPIPDLTQAALVGMLLTGLVVAVLSLLATWLGSRGEEEG